MYLCQSSVHTRNVFSSSVWLHENLSPPSAAFQIQWLLEEMFGACVPFLHVIFTACLSILFNSIHVCLSEVCTCVLLKQEVSEWSGMFIKIRCWEIAILVSGVFFLALLLLFGFFGEVGHTTFWHLRLVRYLHFLFFLQVKPVELKFCMAVEYVSFVWLLNIFTWLWRQWCWKEKAENYFCFVGFTHQV